MISANFQLFVHCLIQGTSPSDGTKVPALVIGHCLFVIYQYMVKNANEYVNIIYFYHVVQIYDIKLHSSPSSGILRTINVVEHCTGIAEVWVRIPSRPEFSCLSCVYTWSTKCFYRNTLDHCDYQNVTLFTRANICCQHVVPVSVTNHSFQVVVSSLKGFIHWANIFGAGKIRPSLRDSKNGLLTKFEVKMVVQD